MKKLFVIGLAVLMVLVFVAPLAMAAEMASAKVDCKLSIAAYAYLGDMPTEVTLALADGCTAGCVGFWPKVVSNVACTVTAEIVEEVGVIGTWSVDPVGIVSGSTPGQQFLAVGVRVVDVPFYSPPITGIKQATLTLTVSTL